MTPCNSRSSARLKAFRAMIFSAADHFKSCIGVPEGARLGKLVIFRSSKAAFYLRPLSAEKRDFSNERPTCIQFVQLTRLFEHHGGSLPGPSLGRNLDRVAAICASDRKTYDESS
jgi:hypothetical protein